MNRIILFLILGVSALVQAQNTPRFSQFNVSKGLLNPAAVGTEATYSAELIYRNQWLGVSGAPRTAGFVAGAELIPSMAVGVSAIYDEVGITRSTSINASYAYRVIFNEDQYLAFGASTGVHNMNVDYAGVALNDMQDPAFERGYNKWLFNAGVGVYFNGPNMYAGASIPQLVQNVYRGDDKGFTPPRWHYYVHSGFYIGAPKSNYMLNPCVQVKMTHGAPVQGDILLRNIFKGTFAFTLGYRTENALIAGFDIMIANKSRIGYSFNYNIGPTQLSGTAHEIYLGFGLPFYYDGTRFSKRKYLNKKGGYSRDYSKSTKRGKGIR